MCKHAHDHCSATTPANHEDRKRPPYSIADGCDFGNLARVGVPPLTFLEVSAIAPGRMYAHILKLSGANAGRGVQATLRAHLICFAQAWWH